MVGVGVKDVEPSGLVVVGWGGVGVGDGAIDCDRVCAGVGVGTFGDYFSIGFCGGSVCIGVGAMEPTGLVLVVVLKPSGL